MLFAAIDHGAWLSAYGIRRRMIRWILGNPTIAITMLRHDLDAGLFVPVELLVTETFDPSGTKVLYVRPSSLVAVSKDDTKLAAAAGALDAKLIALVDEITGVEGARPHAGA